MVEEDKTIDTEFTKDDGGFHAIVQGTVTVSLYTMMKMVNTFIPSGMLIMVSILLVLTFVAAYYAEDGREVYVDQTSITNPSIDGDKFEFEIHEDDVSGIRIYAASDYWDDGIIGTADPIGNYPDVIYDPDTNDDYNIITGIDINILVPYWDGLQTRWLWLG